MNRIMLAATAAMALITASAATATVSIGGSLAFAPATTINFEQASEGASLNGYYSGSGVTFSSVWETYGYNFGPDLSAGGAINFTPVFNTSAASDFVITFSSVHHDAGLSVVSDAPGTFSTYLGGSLVESAFYGGGYHAGADVISFTNSNFDSIRYTGTGDHAILFDNLGFGAGSSGTPEPASWALMLLGVGGLGGALRARRKAVAA